MVGEELKATTSLLICDLSGLFKKKLGSKNQQG